MAFDEKGIFPDNQARDLAYLFRNDTQDENIRSQTKMDKKTVAIALFFIIYLWANRINRHPARSAVKGVTNISSAIDYYHINSFINFIVLQVD